MAERKPFLGTAQPHPELDRLLESTVTDEELREQRISFAYGNSDSELITKESLREASRSVRIASKD